MTAGPWEDPNEPDWITLMAEVIVALRGIRDELQLIRTHVSEAADQYLDPGP
jgi:hypothetical protein